MSMWALKSNMLHFNGGKNIHLTQGYGQFQQQNRQHHRKIELRWDCRGVGKSLSLSQWMHTRAQAVGANWHKQKQRRRAAHTQICFAGNGCLFSFFLLDQQHTPVLLLMSSYKNHFLVPNLRGEDGLEQLTTLTSEENQRRDVHGVQSSSTTSRCMSPRAAVQQADETTFLSHGEGARSGREKRWGEEEPTEILRDRKLKILERHAWPS